MKQKTKILAVTVPAEVDAAISVAAEKKHLDRPGYLRWRIAEAVAADGGFKPDEPLEAA